MTVFLDTVGLLALWHESDHTKAIWRKNPSIVKIV
jgi:hypothetical protein